MPILNSNTLEFLSRSPEQTRRLGMRLGALMESGDLICLTGDLGSGKTTFIQGLAQGWGSLNAVTSPTFVLVNQYRKVDGSRLYHLDAYRLQNAFEAEDLDIDQMLESGAMVVEWAEKIRNALPAESFWMDMSYIAEEQRGMVFHSNGERYHAILHEFRHTAFGG